MSNPYADAAAGMAADGNRFSAAAAELADEQRVALRTSAYAAAATHADTAASAARLSRQAGLPLDVVQRNQPQVQRQLAAERIDADTAIAPRLRNRYADPAFAAVAHDDSQALARLEQTAGSYTFGNALKKGAAGAKLTLDFLADQAAKAFGADRAETQRILGETAGYYRSQGSDPQLQAAGERAKAAGGGTWYGTLLHLPGEVAEAEDPFELLGKFVTEQLPSAVAGFGIGTAVTAPVRSAIVGKVSSQLVATGVNASLAGAAGNSTAVVLQSLGTNYSEGLSQGLPADQAAERAWTKTLAEVPANAVAGAAMGLRLGPNQLTNILGQTAVQGAGGGTGATMAAHSVGEQADPVEVALEILGEGISAGPEVAGLTFTRIAQSRTIARAEAAAIAVVDAQHMGELIKAADSSALKARDAETFADLVEHLQPETAVFIAPEHLAGVDLSGVPGLAPQVAEAQATGGDVQLRLADLLAHLPGQTLLPNLRMQPDGLTQAEAEGFDGMAELESEMTEAEAPPMTESTELNEADWDAYYRGARQGVEDMKTAQAAHDLTRRAEAIREARSMRDLHWLANRKDEALQALNSEAEALKAEIGAQAVQDVRAQPLYAALRELATADGDHVMADFIAEQHGFRSADAVQLAAKTAPPEHKAIGALVEERMRERHPDLFDAISRERAAEAMVADRARTRFLATEAAALSNALGSRQALERDANHYAAESIGRYAVRDIRPARFQASADRAGRRAAAAFRTGNTAEAARQKRNQMLQDALHGHATSARAEIEHALAGFKAMFKANDGTRDGNLADTARAVLAQYGLGRTEKTAAEYLAQVEHYDPELHADLLQLMDGMPAPAIFRDLTMAEFREMRDRVEAVWTLARTTRQIEIDGQMVEIRHAAELLAAQLATEKPAKREAMVGTNDRLDLRMRLAGVRAALRRVEFWSDARDGGARDGPFRRFVWQPVSEAVTRYRTERNAYVGRFLELLKPIEPTLSTGKIDAPELGMVFADRSALLHALLHTGNESNKRKLLLGYRWASVRDDGSLETTAWDAFLKRMHAEGRITAADWQFAQGVWSLLEEMKPAAQTAHKRMFGHYFAEITAEPVQTPFGEFSGGYVPAMTDTLLVPEARQHGAMNDMLASQNSPMFPSVARGFTKGRVEYNKPLALDLRLLPAHIDKVSRFAVLGPVLRDGARLVTRNKVFREAMDAVDPTAVESMLVPWLKRTATQSLNRPPETQADRAIARIANTVRNRTGLLLMAGNVVNTLQQVTGLSVAALRVKPKHLAAGLLELTRTPTASARAIGELSEWMRLRGDTGAKDVDQAIDRLLTNPNALQQAEQFGMRYGFALQQAMQNIIDRTVWLGAYRQAQAEGVDDTQAVRDADAAVRMTQGSFAPEDASKVEHAGAFTRLFLQFASYFNSQGNLLATEVQNAKGPGRLAVVYMLGFAVPAFLADVIAKGARGELEDDDDLAAELVRIFATSQARYAVAMVPVAGQVGNAAIGQFTPEAFDDRIGASPTYSAVEATVRAPRSIYRALEGDGNTRAAVRDGLTAVGVLTGLPVGPLVRPLGYLADDEREDITVQGLATGVDR
jgi:hypothetical protein